MYKFNYKFVQNMQCLVTQILFNMLKFHSDMAKQKSLESKSYLKYYAVLDSHQVFRNGFIFENTSTLIMTHG